MARVHRAPPPVPVVEHDDDNYGVWSDSEFDDPQEIYENTEAPPGEGEDDDDYEEPDEPVPANSAVRPLPSPAAPAIPPIPPRPGFRPVPTPASLMPEPRRGGVSPRTSPVPPEPAEDEETYEAIDMPQTPPIDDDGEVYEVVDDSPMQAKPSKFPAIHSLRPVPKPVNGGLRAHPPIPVPEFQQKEIPSRKSKQPEIKRAVSPNLPKIDVPLPPPVKSAPPGRAPIFQRPSPQPSPPPPPEMDEMYAATDFYADADRDSPLPPPLPSGLAKPLPRPPNECADDEGDGDEFYEEVPEVKSNLFKAKADRPIPPVPQLQPFSSQETPSASSSRTMSRFPVEKLQAELARMAESNKKPSEPEPAAGVLSSNLLKNAMNKLKPVNRGESLNTPEKPKVVQSVKRAESENTKRPETVVKKSDTKISRILEATNKFESDEKQPEKQGIKLSPMFPKKQPYSADTSGNRNTQPVARINPFNPVPSVVPNKKPAVRKPETSETLAPPLLPVSRASPVRNLGDETNSKGTKSSAASKSTPNDMRALPKPPTDELGGLHSYAWYFSAIERNDAEKRILEMQQDGAFLVRESKRGGESNPYTLTLLYKSSPYNLHVRRRSDQKYALGTEKPDEHVFTSVEDLISFHRNNPIEVIGKNAAPGKVVLKGCPKK